MEVAYQISIFAFPIGIKISLKMQQNRMHISSVTKGQVQSAKRFEYMPCAPISGIETFDNLGNTIQQKHTQTRVL